MIGSGTIKEVLAVCQPEEMSILSGQGLVTRLCDVFEKHPHRRQNNRSSQVVV